MLLASAPMAMAHDKGNDDKGQRISAEVRAEHEDKGLHLGSFLGLQLGKHKDDDHDDRVGSTTRQERKDDRQADRAQVRSHIVGGTVTSVSGNTFVVSGKKATTTVTLASDVKVVTRDGATSTAAITAGSKVIAFGSTTATSTSGNSFTASIVIVINEAIGHLRDWLRF